MSPGIHSKIGIPDNSITVESCSRERETKSNKKKKKKDIKLRNYCYENRWGEVNAIVAAPEFFIPLFVVVHRETYKSSGRMLSKLPSAWQIELLPRKLERWGKK